MWKCNTVAIKFKQTLKHWKREQKRDFLIILELQDYLCLMSLLTSDLFASGKNCPNSASRSSCPLKRLATLENTSSSVIPLLPRLPRLSFTSSCSFWSAVKRRLWWEVRNQILLQLWSSFKKIKGLSGLKFNLLRLYSYGSNMTLHFLLTYMAFKITNFFHYSTWYVWRISRKALYISGWSKKRFLILFT